MAIIRKKELRKMNKTELYEKLKELRLEIAKQKANIHIGANIQSPGKIREMKKTIARILTIMRERGNG